jgi:predicted glycosyltransferase
MKIVVDINHPADVHFFKNFIWEIQKRGHQILITASEKDISQKLLDAYGFSYINLGNYGNSILKKIINLPLLDFRMYKAVKSYNPDLFIGFGSIRAAHVSWLLRKPCIVVDDTEHAVWEHRLYVPFTEVIITPACFRKDFGEKHVRYHGYTELAYLHPNYFSPDLGILKELGIDETNPIIVVRFVSWAAGHDIGQSGIKNKLSLVTTLQRFGHVFISSEVPLDKNLEPYRLMILPEKLHNVLYYATLYIGEGATIASECAVLGTHAIYVNTLNLGYIHELDRKYHLVSDFSNREITNQHVLETAEEILNNNNSRENGKLKRNNLLFDAIDVTKFIVWFVEHYPESIKIWKEDPEIKNQFH